MSLGNGVMERAGEAVESGGMLGKPHKNRIALSWMGAIPKKSNCIILEY